jgi:hypothetical protein
MAKYDSLLTKLAKDYNAIVNNNTLTFKSENDMTNAADDIANAFAFSLDFDTLTLEFINEAIDIQFIKDSLHLYANESKQNAIKAIMTSCGFANESDIEAVTAQLTDDKLQSKPNIAVDIANSLNNATVQSDKVSFITDGKIYLVKPIDSVELNESTTHVYGTMQFNAAQINAIKSLENDDSRRKFLTSMGLTK